MIEWLVNRIFSWDALRKAIFAEVHMYDAIDKALLDDRHTNLFWSDSDGLWYGWMIQEKHNLYMFDDTGHESVTDLLTDLMERDSEHDMAYL